LIASGVLLALPALGGGSAVARAADTSGGPALPSFNTTALLGACLVGAGLLWLLPRLLRGLCVTRSEGAHRVQILEVHRLGPRRSILLAQVCGQRILLAATEGGISTLATLSPEASVDGGREPGSAAAETDFQRLLTSACEETR
jgi:flagellar biogenesis protein FliO